jgi:acid phosphatase
MAAYHRQYPFPLALLAGDNIYTNGEMEKIEAVFERPYKALLQAGVKFHACLGNHDIRTANGDRQIRYAPLNMAGRYYTVRQGPVQFFALDTNHNADWRSQYVWLEQTLSQSDAPWKVVFGHHPIYSSGRYGTNPNLINLLSPLFTQHGVQLYLNGHEHDYERSQPMYGTTYLVCGIGGARLRPMGRSPWTACAESRFGFAAFEVYEQTIEIRAIGTDGTVFDRATISRQVV